MRLNKRADQKYYIIISLILGLMILAISLSWIFQEYFNEDDLDFEACRQSIVLRANVPEYSESITSWTSFKEKFPLKCKTSVVEVDEEDLPKLEDIIAEKMTECWALFGNGDVNAFSSEFITFKSVCVPCARISLTPDARRKLLAGEDNVDIRASLDQRMTPEYSYYSYLNNSGKKFPALMPGGSSAFNLNGEAFRVGEFPVINEGFYTLNNRLSGEGFYAWLADVDLPRLFYPDKGDLIISYGVTIAPGSSEFGNYIPYLVYFQTGQNPEPFKEAKNGFYDKAFNPINGAGLCETWEGTPA